MRDSFPYLKQYRHEWNQGNAGVTGHCPTLPQKWRYRMKFEMEQCILAEMAGRAKRIASDSLPVEILRGVYLECDEDG